MRINRLPLILTVLGGALVMFVQHWLRPGVPHAHPFRWVLNLSPNLLTAFCAPFAVLIPALFTRGVAARVFPGAVAVTAGVLLWFELVPPLRRGRPFDTADILATLAGAGAALTLFRVWSRKRFSERRTG